MYSPVEWAPYPAAEYDDGHFNKENEFATVNQIKRHTEAPPYETSEKCMFNNSLSISNVEESYRKPLERKGKINALWNYSLLLTNSICNHVNAV